MKSLLLSLLLLGSMSGATNAAWPWQAAEGVDVVHEGAVSLTLTTPGQASSVADNVAVTPGQRIALSFDYTASGLTNGAPLELSLHWFNASGQDLDAARLGLGFPPLARVWKFTHNGRTPTEVSDNLTVPQGAVKASFTLRVSRVQGRDIQADATRVQASGFSIREGEMPVAGLEQPDSGPADAGPLSQPPTGVKFPANMVPNGDLEEGDEVPAGWKIEGDNINGSAGWAKGGAYSGKRAFVLYDRGPYIKSWDRKPRDPYVAGMKPGGSYANAREEVSARWVSRLVPAQAGMAYQATAFYWYDNRAFPDRGMENPVGIQFLDEKGGVIPQQGTWDDWFRDARVLLRTGWVFVPGKPVTAPPGTVFLRAVVRMPHAFATADDELLNDYRSILVDNISVFALPADAVLKDADLAYEAAVREGALPFVPTSPQHRPNSLSVSVGTNVAGGLLIRAYDDAKPGKLSLDLENLLGDVRRIHLNYEIIDINGNAIDKGQSDTELQSFSKGAVAVDVSSAVPYGPYLVRYEISEQGAGGSLKGEARFGIMPPRENKPEEGGRMDYPFSLWMPGVPPANPQAADTIGQLAHYAGVGKTWFGADNIYLDHFVRIKDPVARQAAIDQQVQKSRAAIAYWWKYGITPMGAFQPTQLLDPSLYPVLAGVVKAFVTALKDDIHIWRHGTESIHGGIHELDRATVDGVNGQGSHTYLYWGREGTVRQYWTEYLVAFKAAKEADPSCIFGPQSASDIEGSVLHTFFQVMTNTDLDSFGMNTYIGASSIWPPNEKELARHGIPNLPIYVSEFGVSGASPTKPDHLIAEHAAAQRVVNYWSEVLQSFPNFFQLEQWGMILGNDDGSLTYEGQVRPMYLAYATMTNILGAGKFIARYDLPGIEVRVRKRSVRGGFAAVIHATGEVRPIDLEAGGSPAVFDLWGNRIPTTVRDGVLTIQASQDPVYVVSEREVRPYNGVEMTVDHATLGADEPSVKVTLENKTAKPAPGRLELIQSGPLQISDRVRDVPELKPGQKLSFTFDVRLVGALPDRQLPIKVRYTTGQKTFEMPAGLNFNTAQKTPSGKS